MEKTNNKKIITFILRRNAKQSTVRGVNPEGTWRFTLGMIL